MSVTTIRQWLSVLEASFILFLLPSFFDNISKRLIKLPKLYFYDPGLAGYLLGIANGDQMARDPLCGSIFENLVITDVIKQRYDRGEDPSVFFFRDSHYTEVDLIVKKGHQLTAVEIKSSAAEEDIQ